MSHYSRRAAGSTPKDSFERVYFPYLHLVMRPLARVLLPCALRSRLSANQITLGAFLVYAGSAALFAVGGWSWRVAGAFLLNVSRWVGGTTDPAMYTLVDDIRSTILDYHVQTKTTVVFVSF